EDTILAMLPHMDMRTLLAFRRSSPNAATWVRRHLDDCFHNTLHKFVSDTDGLRSTLRLFQAVISGSFALNYMQRGHATPFEIGDLDIYVPRGYVYRVAHYLVLVEHYHFDDRQANQYPKTAAFKTILRLAKGDIHIDIIESSESSALFPLTRFWATHVQNFMGADAFMLSYPDLTLRSRGLLS
ncbi:hypothetical protein C8T65DRAFT_553015, partial [Cerioporus squamosus]